MKSASSTVVLFFLALLLLSRWPVRPSTLLTFDNVNFALGVERFNPAEHRPQPPGYPLFIGLSRLIHSVIEDMPVTFLLVGIAGALLAAIMTWLLASSMAGPTAGLIAGLLVIFHPALWSSNLLNPVRCWLAAGSALIALLAWKYLHSSSSGRSIWLASWFALGVAGGFRPDLTGFLGPLLLYCGWRRETSLTQWMGAMLCLALGVLPWLWPVVAASGGLQPYVALLRSYLQEQSESTSVFYGGSLIEAVKMAGRAILWLTAGAAGWIWFVRRDRIPSLEFLAVWALPSLLFVTLIHSAEPGHVLILVPVLAAMGGAVAAALKPPLQILAIVVPAFLFFFAPPGPLRASGWKGARGVQNRTEALLTEIRAKQPAVMRIDPDAPVAWRLISYYFPDMTVVVPQADKVWSIRNNRLISQSAPDAMPMPLLSAAGLKWESAPIPEASPLTPEAVNR